MLTKVEDVVFGTWGISGAFGVYSLKDIQKVVFAAVDLGIKIFDSAIVYKNGEMDAFLHKILPSDCIISTKIPALVKPKNSEQFFDIETAYPIEYVKNTLNVVGKFFSNRPFIVQLHNWHHSWCPNKLLNTMLQYKGGNLIKIGVSVPDEYNSEYPEGFDMVQSAYNLLNHRHTEYFKKNLGEKWGREVFCHGVLTKLETPAYSVYDARSKKITPELLDNFYDLKKALNVDTAEDLKTEAIKFCISQEWIDKIVIGFTKVEQVENFSQIFSNLITNQR